jgi:hypothetical protein
MAVLRIREPKPCGGKVAFSGTFGDPGTNGSDDIPPNVELFLDLPPTFTLEQRKWLITDFVREALTRGTDRVAQVTIHEDPCWSAHVVFAEPDVSKFEQRWREKWKTLVRRYSQRFAPAEFREMSDADKIENYRQVLEIINDELGLEKIHDACARSFDRADAFRRIVLVVKGVNIG